MIFKLKTSGYYYDQKDQDRLKKLGFTFEKTEYCSKGYKAILDIENITIEINSLEELMEFIQKYGQIVLDNDRLEIYDDYRE